MRYVKIRSNNYNEAMMKLRMEYGDDAIPISHKYIKEGGILSSRLFAKEMVELTAGIQEREAKSRGKNAKKGNIDFTVDDNVNVAKRSTSTLFSRLNGDEEARVDGPEPEKKENIGIRKEPARREKTIILQDDERANDLLNINRDEITSLKKLEREIPEIKNTLKKLLKNKTSDAVSSSAPLFDSEDDVHLNYYAEILKKNEFEADDYLGMIHEMRETISPDELQNKQIVEQKIKDLLIKKIQTTGPIKVGNKKKVVMFFGPTGVGKTTTMAKLGAIYSLRKGHSVSFITIDNYRIAATEQLKKYSEIMKIPIHVVNDQKKLKDVIEKEKAEIILIDTSGRSHRNELKLSEIKSFADVVEYDFERILCVCANTKKEDLNDILKAFNTLEFNSIIVTKIDETSYLGNVIVVSDKHNKPISYCTNGQEVPNDIMVAEPDTLADIIIGNN